MKKIVIGIVGFLIVIIGFYFSPYSKKLLKEYVKDRVCFINKFNITYFNYTINSFALKMEHDDNKVDLVGNFYPFNGTYEAVIKNLSFINPLLKGGLTSSGTFHNHQLNGNLILAQGIGKFNIKCDKEVNGNIQVKDVDFKKFFSMVEGFNLSVWKKFLQDGKISLNIDFDKNIKVNGIFNGNIKFLSREFPAEVKLLNMTIFKSNNRFVFNTFVKSKYLEGNVSGKNLIDDEEYKGKFSKFDLTFLRQFLIYPIVGYSNLDFTYNKIYNNIFFDFKGFSGYYQNKKVNIQFKENYRDFFGLLNLKPILTGIVSGNISINLKNDMGSFDLLFKNSKFLLSSILLKIERLTHINLHSSSNTFFVNGVFDREKVKFEVYNKNLEYKLFVKNAVYNYKDKNLSADITISNNESLFKLRLKDGKVKILSKRFYNPRKEIIVQ